MGKCANCGHVVKSGGDRHAKFRCPPKPGVYGEHRRAVALRKRRNKHNELVPQRGAVVAGTGVRAGEANEKK